MRVIAGSARHLMLKTVPGTGTRPTTDRIKETLFNILRDETEGAVFLDLFAGSGAIGIEALSRGAKSAVFVDSSAACCACIKENLRFTHLEDRALVIRRDVLSALKTLPGGEPFSIVFMDPPYGQGLEKAALAVLAESDRISGDTLLIAEADVSTDFSYLPLLGLQAVRVKSYKTNMHVFIKRAIS